MKQKRLLFNQLLFQYNKYRRKLTNLQNRNKNERRQSILEKKIGQLFQKLQAIKNGLKLTTAATVVAIGASVLTPQSASAQNFLAPVVSPYGLDTISNTSAPYLVDLDNDGDMDLVSGDNYGDFYYFEDTSSTSTPAYDVAQMNPFGITNIGGYGVSTPTFTDLDSDGDMDMLSGNGNGSFYYFENTGSASVPAFAAPSQNPFGLAEYTSGGYTPYTSAPDFVDLDNDGDMDMLSGSGYFYNSVYGQFYYYENTGTATAPAFAPPQSNPFGLTSVYYGAPSFSDLDGDGDMDMLSGEYYNNFNYFENTGSATAPNFAASIQNPFNLTALVDNRSRPTFSDIDNDGDADLLAGSYGGTFTFFENCTPTSGSIGVTSCDLVYTSPSGNYSWSTPGIYIDTLQNIGGCDSVITINLSFATVDVSTTQSNSTLMATATGASYQWLDCANAYSPIAGATNQQFVATTNGSYAVQVTENGCADTSACLTVNTVGLKENEATTYKMYPNPVNNELNIEGKEDVSQVEVFNLTGQLLQTIIPQNKTISIDFTKYEQGLYLIKVYTKEGEISTARVVKK